MLGKVEGLTLQMARALGLEGDPSSPPQERDITLRQILNCLLKGTISEGPALDIHGDWKMNVYRQADDLTCAVAIKWRTHLTVITVF